MIDTSPHQHFVGQAMIPHPAGVTGVVLCGGQGRRMGGQDKGLLIYQGRPLVCYALEALSGVADQVLINANRNLDIYEALGYPVFCDETADYPGPLAGLLTALRRAVTPWVLTLPCDMPCFGESDLIRLCSAWQPGKPAICTVDDGVRLHPVVALVDRGLADSLACYLSGGGRKVQTWFCEQPLIRVDFSDRAGALRNLNTPDDWE
ncbi:molybdenum cofactor guanylyltransferase [Candidatus Woesearchaeota archaeon]|jgi:molybdopterin-guanine dinucleotide biosynthesis protein A|nr:molybdenum cofactor guanylyltransferase [Candidatus Woesearchaeota archaeon]